MYPGRESKSILFVGAGHHAKSRSEERYRLSWSPGRPVISHVDDVNTLPSTDRRGP